MHSCLFALAFLAALPISAASFEGVALPLRQAELSAPVSSRLAELKVQEGEAVKAGQLLAKFYARFEELEMERAKALLDRREFEAKGARKLFESKVIPEARALESRLELELARLQYETAAEQVRLRLLTAPFDGVVVARYRELGEAVATSQPVFRLVDLSRVQVRLLVPAEALGAFAPGQKLPVRFPQLGEGPGVPGMVTLVDPLADAQGRFRVVVTVENPEGKLRSGLKALVETP